MKPRFLLKSSVIPEVLAPEVLWDDGLDITPSSDVYSFGVVCWETITRRIPWHGMRHAQIVYTVGLRAERLPIDELPTLAGSSCEYLEGLLNDCFADMPKLRPSFDTLCTSFSTFLQELVQGVPHPGVTALQLHAA